MRRLLSLALALTLCLSLTGCWEPDIEEPEEFWELEQPEETNAEESAAPAVFTLPWLSSQTLDPIACSDGAQQSVASLLYEGLFALDERFEPQNALCASFSRSGLTYTFTLRENAAFSDGSPLTSADVLATYRRAQASERYGARFANIVSMRGGNGTISLTLSRADSALPALLDIPIVKSGTEKETAPLGTGPYRVVTEDGVTSLVRNAVWWGDGSALPERVALSPAKDADTAAYLFSAGKVHLLTADLLGDSPAASIGGTDVVDVPTTTLLYLGCNTRRAALSDKTLRAALGAAIDRRSITASLLAQHACPAQFPLSSASPLYPAALETAFASDAYAAALEGRLVSNEDNTPAGSDPIALTLLVNEESAVKTALAAYLAEELTASYLTVTVLALPWEEYLDALQSGEFDLYLGETRLTADWDVSSLVGSNGALNYGGYANAALDAALTAFLADENETTAAAFCALLAEEAPILPLVFKSASVLTPAGTVGVVAPTVSHPLRALEQWTFSLDEKSSP